ncbi:helix-turn-helix transcriptional regulator [Agrobacterium rubi]|nr:helix-turn-helix transcriptional regulator [Agrobacterium rubi]NTF23736.1 helix-turn-helix transcriptional regulator [Agrobacterium rubi]
MKKIIAMRSIPALRLRDGLSQEDLAQRIGASQQAVAKWENGRSNPGTRKLMAMADVFDCSLDTLIGRAPVVPRRATLEEKLLEFSALDLKSPAAENVDSLTREVFEDAMANPEGFAKRASAMQALIDLQKNGGPSSLTELIDTVLAA